MVSIVDQGEFSVIEAVVTVNPIVWRAEDFRIVSPKGCDTASHTPEKTCNLEIELLNKLYVNDAVFSVTRIEAHSRCNSGLRP